MGLIKGILKVGASAILVATGTASTVLKGMSDAAGIEIGSEIFGAAKDASFNGIRGMWDNDGLQTAVDKAEEISDGTGDAMRRQMATTARRAAQIARQNGDMEKYEYYMEQYENYKD